MDETVTTIHVTKVLTTLTIIDLFEEYPNLREITCAPSVYNRISKKYIGVLEEVGITVKKKYNGIKFRLEGRFIRENDPFQRGNVLRRGIRRVKHIPRTGFRGKKESQP